MTIPTTIDFPLRPESLTSDIESIQIYLSELTVALQEMYEILADNANGNILSNAYQQNQQWIPTLDGSSTSGTFTYVTDHQIGWVKRQGIMIDVWFDIAWTAVGTATGNLILNLPYEVAETDEKPFVGICQPSSITFTGGTGIVINAIPNSFTADFWNIGDGFATANQSVVSSGQLIGHLRYIGVQDE